MMSLEYMPQGGILVSMPKACMVESVASGAIDSGVAACACPPASKLLTYAARSGSELDMTNSQALHLASAMATSP
eukprot:9416981-Alexandrium_andersonii.AAC.1